MIWVQALQGLGPYKGLAFRVVHSHWFLRGSLACRVGARLKGAMLLGGLGFIGFR